MKTVESEVESEDEIDYITKEKEIDIQLGAKYLMQPHREMREIEVQF